MLRRHASQQDPLAVMASAYRAPRSTFEVGKRLQQSCAAGHPDLSDARPESFVQVVGVFTYNDREDFDAFRSGALPDWVRDMMIDSVALYERDAAAAGRLVDIALADLAEHLQ